jgi:phage shock protein E
MMRGFSERLIGQPKRLKGSRIMPSLHPLIFLALFAQQAAPDARPSIDWTTDSLAVVKQNLAKDKAVLVDVRSVEEWKKGTIEGALFVPIDSLRKYSLNEEKVKKALPPKEEKKILYTYCVVGMRAKAAGNVLNEQGYEVRPLKPGYEDLLKAGFKKVEPKDEKEKTP